MSEKKEALRFLKEIDKDHLLQIASKYMDGGGFGDITKMTKPQIIKILMSGKTSYFNKGGTATKKAIGSMDYRTGGMVLSTVDNRKK